MLKINLHTIASETLTTSLTFESLEARFAQVGLLRLIVGPLYSVVLCVTPWKGTAKGFLIVWAAELVQGASPDVDPTASNESRNLVSQDG